MTAITSASLIRRSRIALMVAMMAAALISVVEVPTTVPAIALPITLAA